MTQLGDFLLLDRRHPQDEQVRGGDQAGAGGEEEGGGGQEEEAAGIQGTSGSFWGKLKQLQTEKKKRKKKGKKN